MRLLSTVCLLISTLAFGASAQTAGPDFSKAFAPATIGPGSVTTLTFTIDNTNAGTAATGLAFTDVFPAGMTVAAPAEAATTCDGGGRGGTVTVTADPGTGSVALANGAVPAGESCTVTVNVTSATVGVSTNTSGALTSSAGTGGTASADLTVDAGLPGFTKSFAPSTVAIGGRSTLTFTIDNTANSSALGQIVFDDALPSGMTVASPSNLTTTCTDRPPTTLTASGGTITVQFFGQPFSGSQVLAAGAACTVSVDVETTAGGALGNVASELTTSTTSSFPAVLSSGRASAVLTSVASTLTLTKSFLQDPVPPGGTVPLRFTLRNIDRRGTASAIAFDDDLGAVVPGLAATTALPIAACGGTLSSPDGGATLQLTGGTLASSETCAFEVDVLVPAVTSTGAYLNTTTAPTGLVDGDAVAGLPAEATLFVQPFPLFTQSFLNDPVSPGGTVSLEYTITNSTANLAATDLAFTDELTDIFGSPLSVTLPAAPVCGPSSSLTVASFGTGREGVDLSMGSLAPGASCTFAIDLVVPLGLAGEDLTNATSEITAVVGGQAVAGPAAGDVLSVVPGPQLAKVFLDDPVTPGNDVTLEFTLALGPEVSTSATGVAFTDDLGAALSGLAAASGALPLAACGGTLSTSDGGATLTFSGGTLLPDETCVFTVPVTVPSGATSGTYTNTTSPLAASIGGAATVGAAATDDLVVTELRFTKSFLDDPVAPGGSVTLEYRIQNASLTESASDLSFSETLSSTLPGLTATADSGPTVCGGGTLTNSGTILSLSGGTLSPGTDCTFTATLSVPASTPEAIYPSTSAALSGTVGGSPVSEPPPPAFDALEVSSSPPTAPPTLAAAFDPGTIPLGATSVLTLTIDNSASGTAATGLAVTATLPAGAVIADPSDASTTCGAGTATAAAGGSTLVLAGGAVAAGESCVVSVAVLGVAEGMVIAATSDLASSTGSAPATSAKLTIGPAALVVSKVATITDPPSPNESADPGETIRYTLTLTADDAFSGDLAVSDTPDPSTTLVPGSAVFTSPPSAATSSVDIVGGEVVASLRGLSGVAELQYEVTVNATYPDEAVEVCNQATVTADLFEIRSDDPSTPAVSDATCLPLNPLNEPPVAVAAADQETAECTGTAGAAFVLDGSGSSDPDGDDLTYTWTGPFPEGGGTVTGLDPTVTLPLGTSTITLTVTDPGGLSDSADLDLTVEDTTGPVITLNGDAALEVLRFSGAFLDPGAEAVDACDGPVAVSVAGSVDTTVPGASTLTYSASDAAGNGAEATREVTVVDDPAAIASAYLFLGEKKVKVDSQVRTEGDVHANDKLEFKNGIRARDGGPSLHIGNLTSADDLKVHKDQRIEGDVTAPDIDVKNGAVVTGAVTEASVAVVPLPTVAVSASGADVDVDDDAVLALPPGSYGKLDVGRRATITLSSGIYTFEEIKLDEDARLEAILTTGPITVNVEDKMDLKRDNTIAVLPGGEADARYLTFRVADGNVDIGDGSVVAAQILAPESKVTLDKEVRFVGAIVADDIHVKDETVALFVTAVVSAPLATVEGDAPDAGPTGTLGEDEAAAGDAVATPAAPQTVALPEVFALGTAYPNPTDRAARVRYDVPEAATVRLAVFDALGREVAVLVDGPVAPGRHEALFAAHRLPAGTYLVRFTADQGFAQVRAVTLVR